jgi:hypothetical protein
MPKHNSKDPPPDPLAVALAFLESVPKREAYADMTELEAYLWHADVLECFARENDRARGPRDTWTWHYHTEKARQTRIRARLCHLVGNGQSREDAIVAVLAERKAHRRASKTNKRDARKKRIAS